MYLSLDKSFLEKTMASANKDAITEFGDDGKDLLLYKNLDDTNVEIEVTESTINISFDNKLGFFSMEIPTDEVMEDIVAMAIKKMNKIKALMETLK